MPQRQLRPKDDRSIADSSESTSNDVRSKRRAVSSACIPCRKRKSKCDGGTPACSTCLAVYRTECSYDADSDHRRRGALKRDIQSLQQQQESLDIIVASLQALPEQDAISLLHTLRTDTNPEAIAASLRSNVNLPQNYAAQTLEADFQRHPIHSASTAPLGTPISSGITPQIEKTSLSDTSPLLGNHGWFRAPQDAEFVEHLLDLYFAWIHPFHRFFSREHFIFDLRNGRSENCSPVLLNAILSYACHYSDRHAARSNLYQPTTAGDTFFAEARVSLEHSTQPRLTTIQALAIMSLRETSQGRDSNGYQYLGRAIRMAFEMNLQLSTKDAAVDFELRKITFWGIFNLETCSSLNRARLSQLPLMAISADKPQPVERIEAQMWKAYEDAISNNASGVQPLRPSTFQNCLTQMHEITTDMTTVFWAPRHSFTVRKLVATYAQYQEWYNSLPEAFRLENTNLPHVLVLHMCYNASILHLFRPYIKLDLRSHNLSPRELCTQAANQISRLMNALRAMYGLRRTTIGAVHVLLSASTIHLLNLPNESAATNLMQAMSDLQTLSINHPYATRVVDIIRSLSVKWNIPLPEGNMSSIRFGANLPSPATSIFYANSLPRQQSSSSRERSGDAIRQDSPYPAPESAISDSFDTSMTAATYWQPYANTTMSRMTQEQEFAYQQGMHWTMYNDSMQQGEMRRQSAPEQNDEQQQSGQWHWDG